MHLLKLLLFTFTFYELIVDLEAGTFCQKGQRVTTNGKSCESCPIDNFQPEEKESPNCKPCTICNTDSGSSVKEECTKEKNRKCQCRGQFVLRDSDASTCKCDIGFGLDGTECSKCEDGYFSSKINSACRKWRECKCGVKSNGSSSLDVVCNELPGCSDASNTRITPPSNTYIPKATTSNKMVSLITHLTSQNSHKRAHTTGKHIMAISTTAAPGHTDAYIATGVAFLILGIIGLLVLTTVICKLHITPQPTALKNDSLCRRPVEESGEDSLSSLKLNPGEH